MKKNLFLGSLALVACAETAQPVAPTVPPPAMRDVPPPVVGVPVPPRTIRTALTVRFEGPATQRVSVGTNGANMYRFAVRAERNVEFRFPAFTIASLVSSSGQLGCLVSDSGPNFANFRVMNPATGETVAGPTGLWPMTGSYRQTLGLSIKTFRMQAGDEVSFIVRGDVRRTESSCPFVGQSFAVLAGRDGHFFSPGDVRILDEDRDALPMEIEGNLEIPGNPFTITRPELRVGLGSSVASSTVVKNQRNVRSVAITLTANETSDLLVNRLPPVGVGNIGRDRRRENLRDVVTTCALIDGNTQIGPAYRPDVAGRMDYRELNYVVPRGTTRTLVIQCIVDSTVSTDGDRYSIGFPDWQGIEAVDSDGNSAFVTIERALSQQLTEPSVEITVVNHGTLSIGSNPLTTGRPVSSGPWFIVADYWVQGILENQFTDRAAVVWSNPATAECILDVGIAYDGIVRGQTRVSSGMTSVDVDLSASPIGITSMAGRVQVMVRFDPPRADGPCAIGTQHQFGLALGLTSGEWDSNYSGRVNLRTTGSVSGERIYGVGRVELGNPVMLVPIGI